MGLLKVLSLAKGIKELFEDRGTISGGATQPQYGKIKKSLKNRKKYGTKPGA